MVIYSVDKMQSNSKYSLSNVNFHCRIIIKQNSAIMSSGVAVGGIWGDASWRQALGAHQHPLFSHLKWF